MVTALSVLSSLRSSLDFESRSPRSHPDHASRRPPPPTRTILSVLTRFSFGGLNEYLDDLVARINAPRVNDLSIDFFNDIVFDTPQPNQFISRTVTLEALENAHVVFRDYAASVNFSSQTYEKRSVNVGISRRALDWQVSSLEQVCTSCLPPLSSTEDLYIHPDPDSRPHWQDNIENSLWLGLLHPFGTVKNIHLSEEFAPRIASALQELVGGRTMEVLPTLQNIFWEELQPLGPVQEGIEKFVAARQLPGHSIAVFLWESSVTEVDD